jgi:hypothetical protein
MTAEHSYVEVGVVQEEDERRFSWHYLVSCGLILLATALALYLFFALLPPKSVAH